MTRTGFSGVALAVWLVASATGPVLAQPAVEQQAIASATELSMAFRHAAREALPAVVSIKTRTAGRAATQGELNPAEQELFRRFFGDSGVTPQFRGQAVPPRQGQGSGFVIDPSGIIMTNSHVVEGADTVTIHFQDGTELVAESWHGDTWSDVAIVRVKPDQPLKALAFGDSQSLEIGDWVLALGDPFGVGTSVTSGIISGKGRAPHINEREDFLQTDAAINPGNSGGPLVNLQGEVIGMNTAISTRSGGYDGVGFAVPIHLARWVGQQLIDHGTVARPYLGVAAQPLTAELRRQFGVGQGVGALVAQVFPGSPSQKADVRPGDVIIDVGGSSVLNSVSLQGIVEQLAIGESYPVTVVRGGEQVVLQVQLEQMPDRYSRRTSSTAENGNARQAPTSAAAKTLGLEVAELSSEIRQSLSLADEVQGVVVTAVDPAGPAAEKNVAPGDVIERVGTTPVATVEEFNAAVSSGMGGRGLLLLLRHGEGTRFVVVQPTV